MQAQEAKLYVGNLPYTATEEDIRNFVSLSGHAVESVQIITDRDTGRSKGFGFVTLAPGSDIRKAEQALNGQALDGRPLTVNQAKPREPRTNGGISNEGGRNRGYSHRDSRW